jgi:hypothetical protein
LYFITWEFWLTAKATKIYLPKEDETIKRMNLIKIKYTRPKYV